MEINTSPRSVWTNPIHFLAFGFGSGTLPKAPGTWGTVIGVVFYLAMQWLSLPAYLLTLAVLIIVGIWLCHVTARDLGVHDHPGIVWDEIVGYLVTMIAVPSSWFWIVVGFILFRVFDIWKPFPIRLIDKKVKGGLGIVVDDLLAGVYALIALHVLGYLIVVV